MHQLIVAAVLAIGLMSVAAGPLDESPDAHDARMAWWRDARFGMFIHWGLYAVPAGEWDGREVGGIGEWIQHIGQIPIAEYEPLVDQFDPVEFDADAWVQLAKDAGMRYIVITTKHHDGFALFDSAVSEYDVMATPFRRDIMRELADACHRHGLEICWYHSIMDWHHPDYLPRQGWHRIPADGAEFARYVTYLRAQLRELLTNYGDIGVMWFDGEWDDTWTHEHGLELDRYVRSLQPDIIVNNRVDKARYPNGDLAPDAYAGDFGTPEQQIPATGLPGRDWETCMTMNDTWGYRRDDDNWKSPEDLLRKLADIASKGGNFLLNVGPTGDGRIPDASIERLRAMGAWMRINAESIRGTSATPFAHLPWGRCTQRMFSSDVTRLYLHVFDWPSDGRLVVSGLTNPPRRAWLLADPDSALDVTRHEDAIVIRLPSVAPDPINTVVALDVDGRPQVFDPPTITAGNDRFVHVIDVDVTGDPDATVRYSADGSDPTSASPVAPPRLRFDETTTLAVRHFRDGQPISGTRRATFTRVTPRPAVLRSDVLPGVRYEYYEADCNSVDELHALTPVRRDMAPALDISRRDRDEHFGFRFHGLVHVPEDGMYTFTVSSDDGGVLLIGDERVVDHDGLHAAYPKSGAIALATGLHPIEVLFFEKGGDESLDVWIEGPGLARRTLGEGLLFLD